MNIEIHKPELARMVQEEIQSGRFNSIDERLTEALRALRERKSTVFATQEDAIQHARELAADKGERFVELQPDGGFAVRQSTPKQDAVSPASASEPFWKGFTRQLHALPNAVFERLPDDGASEHDPYLYGAPKRNA
jgi:Arc/MetJ-type ribon-helix-helix transcriptional regulator